MKKIKINSPFILTFTFLSFIILILGYISNNYITNTFFCTYRNSIFNPLMYLRLFTHTLGHKNFQHWLNNILYLLILGPILEEKYGTKNLTIMVLICSFVTGIVNNIFFTSGLYGASGIVFMFIILASITNLEKGTIPLTFILVVVLYLGGEIVHSFSNDDISQLTHILGGIIGSFFGFYLNKKQG